MAKTEGYEFLEDKRGYKEESEPLQTNHLYQQRQQSTTQSLLPGLALSSAPISPPSQSSSQPGPTVTHALDLVNHKAYDLFEPFITVFKRTRPVAGVEEVVFKRSKGEAYKNNDGMVQDYHLFNLRRLAVLTIILEYELWKARKKFMASMALRGVPDSADAIRKNLNLRIRLGAEQLQDYFQIRRNKLTVAAILSAIPESLLTDGHPLGTEETPERLAENMDAFVSALRLLRNADTLEFLIFDDAAKSFNSGTAVAHSEIKQGKLVPSEGQDSRSELCHTLDSNIGRSQGNDKRVLIVIVEQLTRPDQFWTDDKAVAELTKALESFEVALPISSESSLAQASTLVEGSAYGDRSSAQESSLYPSDDVYLPKLEKGEMGTIARFYAKFFAPSAAIVARTKRRSIGEGIPCLFASNHLSSVSR